MLWDPGGPFDDTLVTSEKADGVLNPISQGPCYALE
jgi:hypothetical protein